MREKVLLVFFLLIVSGSILAQARSTKEMKLTLVVNEENTKILDLELFDEKQANSIKKRYPGSKLFIGLLNGSYELEDKRVSPNAGATITIFTDRQFFPNERFFPKEDLAKGDQLNIGLTKAKITSNAKGEITLVTQ